MSRALNWQTVGASAVASAFVAAEAGARYLEAHPASAFAWWLNLGPLRPFEIARAGGTPLRLLFGPPLLEAALLALAAILACRLAGFRLGVAFAANLSFLAAAELARTWITTSSAGRTASLGGMAETPPSATLLVLGLLAASSLAATLSHLGFLARIRRDGTRAAAAGCDRVR